jgi:hypothetical protein
LSCGFELIFCAIGLPVVVPDVLPVDVPVVLPLPDPVEVVDPVVVDDPVPVLVVVPLVVFFGEWPCVVVVVWPLPCAVADTAA